MPEVAPDGEERGSKGKSAMKLKYSFKTVVINVLVNIIGRYPETALVRDPLAKNFPIDSYEMCCIDNCVQVDVRIPLVPNPYDYRPNLSGPF